MNKNHTLLAMLTTVSGALVTAYAPAIRAVAEGHPYISGFVVAVVSAILGVLPSATGSDAVKS